MDTDQIPQEVLDEEKESLIELRRKLYEFGTEKASGLYSDECSIDNLILKEVWYLMNLIRIKYPDMEDGSQWGMNL